ncbi:hypothetical protein ACQV2S_01290 [Facklamia sp. P13064]|uniref:hypothetical protein n=1 Tax=Facklamia sp. P13064 TaxID=3421953 RepID=UPI003D17C239
MFENALKAVVFYKKPTFIVGRMLRDGCELNDQVFLTLSRLGAGLITQQRAISELASEWKTQKEKSPHGNAD